MSDLMTVWEGGGIMGYPSRDIAAKTAAAQAEEVRRETETSQATSAAGLAKKATSM